jgi:hypothetical protein
MNENLDDSVPKMARRQSENPDKGPLDTKNYSNTVEAENAVKVNEIKGNVPGGVKSSPGKYVGTD